MMFSEQASSAKPEVKESHEKEPFLCMVIPVVY